MIMKFLSQEDGSCCFVYAVANCLIYLGLPVPDLEECFDVALCRHGSVIDPTGVVDFMKAPLEGTTDVDLVFSRGGVLNIWHPIYNGHCCFIFPDDIGITAVNSWLGPNVSDHLGIKELKQFVNSKINLGVYWNLRDSSRE